ncbi:hypothetical protein NX773_13480 [Massilia solisilvae]|uniref:Lipoprotein n=1 Tax=Massilia solisilvae TaxID=1811225 RepID=A0ABT2BKY2_9BURK|nr:hypothetical protein [Massilia solisilvae]MCS0609178.1 hypothetical protein [Massilia solisilvae]
MKSLSFILAVLLAAPALAADPPVHKSDGMLVDAKGMTVYTFDQDKGGKSTCTGQCAENWPPVAAGSATLESPYSSITREDGTKQLTYKGKPLYTFSKDKSPGDKKGDKVKDMWHVVSD